MNTRHSNDDGPAFRPLESITVVAVIGLLALALGLFALLRPASVVKDQKLAYTQSGTFAYSASAPTNSVYGAKGLTSGQPILTKITGPVRTSFAYKIVSDAPAELHGTAALNVKVDLGQGFSRTFPIAASHAFTGNGTTLSGELPWKAIDAYVTAANRDLGGSGGAGATVTLEPRISVTGTIGGHRLDAKRYAPTLPFTLSGTTLTLANPSAGADPSAPDAKAADPLHPSTGGSVSYSASEPNTLPLPGIHPSVAASRIVGLGVALICLLLCLWLARPLRAGRSVGDRDRIRALYGAQLVPVSAIDAHFGPIVEVAGIEALAELAKKYESMIMQLVEPEADAYLVWDNGIMFRYRVLHPAASPVLDTAASPPSNAADDNVVVPKTESEIAESLGRGRSRTRAR